MDEDQQFEEMAKKYPDLLSKAQQDYLGVGEGWHHILDILFRMISSDVEQARYQIRYAEEHPTNKFVKPMDELEANLAKALSELPVIAQIKEKFGGLRVYVDGGTEQHHSYIAFACAIASNTCEVCGNRGKPRQTGWTKTLCDQHHAEREKHLEDVPMQ